MRGFSDSDPKCGYQPPKDGTSPTFYGRLQPPAMPILGARVPSFVSDEHGTRQVSDEELRKELARYPYKPSPEVADFMFNGDTLKCSSIELESEFVARELQEKERGDNTSDNRGEQSSQR